MQTKLFLAAWSNNKIASLIHLSDFEECISLINFYFFFWHLDSPYNQKEVKERIYIDSISFGSLQKVPEFLEE
jgi:hypothetical protein